MPAIASTMPITSSLRSGESFSQNDGSGAAGRRAAPLEAACLFGEEARAWPLRLLLTGANGLRRGIGRWRVVTRKYGEARNNECKKIIAQMVCLPLRYNCSIIQTANAKSQSREAFHSVFVTLRPCVFISSS